MIRNAWLSYVDLVVPKDALAIQIQKSRRAFYAGAKALYEIVVAVGDRDVPEDIGLEMLEQLKRELDAFKEDVIGGRA